MRIDIAMPDPARTAAAELKSLLEARGVRVTGAARAQHGAPPVTHSERRAGAGCRADQLRRTLEIITVLAEHLSQPLIEIVRVTNKVSQNLHAETSAAHGRTRKSWAWHRPRRD